MIIKLTPSFRETQLKASKSGDIITLNGEVFDFSQMVDGDTLPKEAIPSEWFADDVSKEAGVITVTLLLPFGHNVPETTRFPEPIINPPDGEIALPAYDIEEPTENV